MGGGKNQKVPKEAKNLGDISMQQWSLLKPLFSEGLDQTLLAMMGGSGAFNPSVFSQGPTNSLQNTGNPNAGTPASPAAPALYGRADLENIWKGIGNPLNGVKDVNTLMSFLPESFTGQQFQDSLNTNNKQLRKKIKGPNSTLALEKAVKKFTSGGGGTGGVIGAGGGALGGVAGGGGGTSNAGGTLPILQSAIEQSKLGTSKALQMGEKGLAKYGLAGTPFAQTQLNQIRTQGEQQTASIPGDLMQKFIFGLFPTLLGQQGLAFQGLGQAGQIGAQVGAQNAQNNPLGGLMGSLGNLGGMAALAKFGPALGLVT